MRRWLACLGMCCALAACEGGGAEEDGLGDQPPEPPLDPAAADAANTPETPGLPKAPGAGIGDGETGARVSSNGSGTPGTKKDAGTASSGAGPGGSVAFSAPTVGSMASAGSGAPADDSSSGDSESAASAPVVAPSAGKPSSTAVSSGTSVLAPSSEASSTHTTVQSGTLTAGTWDDNRNFERFESYHLDPTRAAQSGVLPLTDDELVAAHALSSQAATPRVQLDVALVIDTTGSMGDELNYLQTEFVAISRAIEAKYPNAAQRWALVLYKDVGDEYLTRYFDFRTDADEFRSKLAAQSAGGGGDFPESPEAAFAIMNQFAWRADPSVAKLAFWVADAPHHDQNAAAFAATLRTTHTQNIHVYPVASSGVNDLTELTMRSAAQLTGGRYLFLTSDSGVGGAHKEPTIPCYFVTKLDDALLRMVDVELTGTYREPDADKVIRTAGDPALGVCTLASGQTVQAY